MTTTKLTAAESELSYLKHNAVFCLIFGLVISGEFLYALLKSLSVAGWVISLVASLYAVAILLLVFTLSKVSRYSAGSTKRAFWYGDFNDEFSAFLNNKGYKYSFCTLSFVLVATWAFAGIDDFSAWFSAVPLKQYAAALACIGMWAYALPVLLGLRADYE